ncbi:MAG: hypothetical protein A3J83_07260 [Elusimicrobia bacterium RIFOXYA2_FULL_40_6]|nr:MAG: hypothetical protein A3J83_07260 [Elusimicrobia bacterium RIFOXYA2_FULL_40_6]
MIGDTSFIPVLKKAMKDTSDRVRWSVSNVLIAFGEFKEARDYVIERCKEKHAYELSIIEKLYEKTKSKDEEFVKIAIEASNKSDERDRLKAAQILKKYNEIEIAFSVFKEIAQKGHRFREYALADLAAIGHEAAINIVLGASNDDDISIRNEALKALEHQSERGNNLALSALKEIEIKGNYNDTRKKAREAINRLIVK